jgi:glycine oxidase
MTSSDVLIIGAGAAGLATAWRLVRRGLRVQVLDAGPPEQAALYAAAGMLTPSMESGHTEHTHPELTQALRWALNAWPDFAQALEAEAGVSIGLDLSGLFSVSADPDKAPRGQAPPMDVAMARTREPALSADLQSACFAPGEGQVDNRRLANALEIAVGHERIIRGQSVTRLRHTKGRIYGVETEDGRFWPAGAVLWAAGAPTGQTSLWAQLQSGESTLPSLVPVKGQACALDRDSWSGPPPTHVIWGPDVYLAPKTTGRVVVGASMEWGQGDRREDSATLQSLIARAQRICPGAALAGVREHWAGVRAATPDEAPLLGTMEGLSGLFIAAGLFRSGVALAPLVSAALSEAILPAEDDEAERWLNSFSAQRFAAAAL